SCNSGVRLLSAIKSVILSDTASTRSHRYVILLSTVSTRPSIRSTNFNPFCMSVGIFPTPSKTCGGKNLLIISSSMGLFLEPWRRPFPVPDDVTRDDFEPVRVPERSRGRDHPRRNEVRPPASPPTEILRPIPGGGLDPGLRQRTFSASKSRFQFRGHKLSPGPCSNVSDIWLSYPFANRSAR